MLYLRQVHTRLYLLQAHDLLLHPATELHRRGTVHRTAGLATAENQAMGRGLKKNLLQPKALPERAAKRVEIRNPSHFLICLYTREGSPDLNLRLVHGIAP